MDYAVTTLILHINRSCANQPVTSRPLEGFSDIFNHCGLQ
uniref:Uncharacterized protein n=1 Tax=viral metagenome TaxID=1070528 RepID=A0A6C0BKK6_9ZZZZ